MLAKLGERIAGIFRATAPDPFVIALMLTAVTFLAAWLLTDATPASLIDTWSSPTNGVWKFLAFSMQMCLILVTGHALAASGPVTGVLRFLSSIPRSGAQAAALVALIACVLGVLNWGLGLIGGALMARFVGCEMARRGVRIQYPILVAAGYMGLMVWHGGLSGTAPTKMTTEAQIRDILPSGMDLDPIALDQTLFSTLNFAVTGGLIVIAMVTLALMMPRSDNDNVRWITAPVDEHENYHRVSIEESDGGRSYFIKILEDTPLLNYMLAVMIGAWAIGYYFPSEGDSGIRRLTPNTVNLTMLMLGLALHRSPKSYMAAVEDGARGCAGIILQFPLYAGIMGMMHASGLTAMLAQKIAAAPLPLPVSTCLSAGVVNLFVPSGGGQWGVQGPIAIESAIAAGQPLAPMVMAVAYGDQLTNMIQPFWALPLLAVTGAKARDIVGYTSIVMVLGLAWTSLCLWVL